MTRLSHSIIRGHLRFVQRTWKLSTEKNFRSWCETAIQSNVLPRLYRHCLQTAHKSWTIAYNPHSAPIKGLSSQPFVISNRFDHPPTLFSLVQSLQKRQVHPRLNGTEIMLKSWDSLMIPTTGSQRKAAPPHRFRSPDS
jgi:hypothetical protein